MQNATNTFISTVPQDGAVTNEGGRRCWTRPQLPQRERSAAEERWGGLVAIIMSATGFPTNSSIPSLSQKIDLRAVIPISYAVCMALLTILFTWFWKWTHEQRRSKDTHSFIMNLYRQRRGWRWDTLCAMSSEQQEYHWPPTSRGEEQSHKSGLPEAEVLGRPPRHRLAEALKISAMDLSQHTSGIFQSLG